MWFLASCIFARLFWRAPETLVKQPLEHNKWTQCGQWPRMAIFGIAFSSIDSRLFQDNTIVHSLIYFRIMIKQLKTSCQADIAVAQFTHCILVKTNEISSAFEMHFRPSDLMSLQCLVPWINHLPPECRSSFWQIYSSGLVCGFDNMNNNFNLSCNYMLIANIEIYYHSSILICFIFNFIPRFFYHVQQHLFPWLRHPVETFSASLAFVRGTHQSPLN